MARSQEEYNAYMAEYMKGWYERRHAEALEQLGGKCVRCGTTENLEIDHIKAETVDRRMRNGRGGMWTVSEERFQAELAKCQLLCHDCHRKKTRENGETGGGHNKIQDDAYQHGTARMYHYKKCRCKWCIKAGMLYKKKLIRIDEVCEE